ncbi:DUF4123 domain-containing protein, partial [Vibrio anguillarum]
MINQWVTQQSGSVYWLVGYKTIKHAMLENGGMSFENMAVLFHGDTFSSVMGLSPWLVPVSGKVLNLPVEILQQGLFLTSSTRTEVMLDHLQSLLIASL